MLQQHLRLRVKKIKGNTSDLVYDLMLVHLHANHPDTFCMCVNVLSLNRKGTYGSSGAACV